MEENFNPVARTRANYYTPGSPVQFVCVELLKGELSGENAVCLTFKNISKVTLTALEIHFKCKGVDGIILCEDAFEYREIEVKPGESFGMDDAVFVTQKAITSVDVVLKNVYSGKKVVHLDAIKRVRLPAPRRLSPELERALESRMNRTGLKYMPQVFENGWYCACGSFHPKEEDTVYCTECGCDRILLQNALNTLLQPGQKAAPAEQAPAAEATRVVSAAPQEEPTRIVASAPVQAEPTRVIPTARPAEPVGAPTSFAPPVEHTPAPEAEPTRVLDAATRAAFPGSGAAAVDDEGTRVMPAAARRAAPAAEATRVVSAAPQEEPTRIVASAPVQAEPTRVIPTARPAEPVGAPTSFAPPVEHTPAPEAEPTRVLDAATRAAFPGSGAAAVDDEGTRVMPAAARRAAPARQPEPEVEQYDEEDDVEESRDGIAETLVRWVPPITAIVCAGIALWGFVYYQFMM